MRRRIVSALIAVSIVFSLFISVNADTAGGVEGFVTRLYEICLDRAPDTDGLNNWVSNLRSGSIPG